MSDERKVRSFYDTQRYLFLMASVVYGILGIAFILVGHWLRLEIRALNEDLENKLKGKLIFSTGVLSIPFIIRGSYNLIGAIIHIDSNIMQPSIVEETWLAPIVYFLYISIADLFPITSQLISMFVVVDDMNGSTVISSNYDKRSETTDDASSFLDEVNEEERIQHLSVSTPYTSSGYYRQLTSKFLTNSNNDTSHES